MARVTELADCQFCELIDADLLAEAMRVTASPTKTAAVRRGLEALIEEEARKRLIALRGQARAAALGGLLEVNDVLLHSWVLGELVLGNLGARRDAVQADLGLLPAAPRVADDEVLEFVIGRGLSGRGIGWVDAQLLASALVASSGLWTFDRTLASTAGELGLSPSE